jgi:hypothetical protein
MLKNDIKKKKNSSKFQEKKHHCTMSFKNVQVSHLTLAVFYFILFYLGK